MRNPIDSDDFSEKRYWFWREKHKELGKKGWLYPTLPKEHGGGGLPGEYEAILDEEFRKARCPHTPNSMHLFFALLVWATEEQKKKFLAPLVTAEKICWQKWTEPHSGSDLASYESTAVRDGDDWILNGSNVFCSGQGDHPDFLWGPMRTDPDAPRHRNLGFFMIPCPTPGLEIRKQKLVSGSDQHFIFLDNVRVPGDHLIGGDHQGWQVTNTAAEDEHGGRGRPAPENEPVGHLMSYLQEKKRAGLAPAGDPVLQQRAVEAYVDAKTDGLFKKRTYWMYMTRQEMSWEGPSQFLFMRVSEFQDAARIRDVMGMYSLVGTKDSSGAPHGGAQEVYQRSSFQRQHGAGSLNITKVVLARRIGISRTKERAAPTPMTAGSHGG